VTAEEKHYDTLRRMIDRRLLRVVRHRHPVELVEACRYVLSGGGKRVRSTLVLLSCEAVGSNARRALNAAIAVELMHNFTLVHDDIMDNASTRRRRPTVHTHWGLNQALLVGDVLLGFAYRQLLHTDPARLARAMHVFTEGYIAVCEGQAMDIAFERRNNVTVEEYFAMIEKKTGTLIATAAELGALIGGGTEREIAALASFGKHVGSAFQLQDDLLDVVADEADFGKSIGGDIIEGKRTFLLLKALERASGKQRQALLHVMRRKHPHPLRPRPARAKQVRTIAAIYKATGAIDEAQRRIHRETHQALRALTALPAGKARSTLTWLAQMLVKRHF